MIDTKDITEEMKLAVNSNITVTVKGSWGGLRRYKIPNKVLDDLKLTAADAQLIVGYHPAGYGIYNVVRGTEYTTWSCSNSCD